MEPHLEWISSQKRTLTGSPNLPQFRSSIFCLLHTRRCWRFIMILFSQRNLHLLAEIETPTNQTHNNNCYLSRLHFLKSPSTNTRCRERERNRPHHNHLVTQPNILSSEIRNKDIISDKQRKTQLFFVFWDGYILFITLPSLFLKLYITKYYIESQLIHQRTNHRGRSIKSASNRQINIGQTEFLQQIITS